MLASDETDIDNDILDEDCTPFKAPITQKSSCTGYTRSNTQIKDSTDCI